MSVENIKSEVRAPAIGVGVLVWKNKKLLLGKRLDQGREACWQFPGGHLEKNESVIDCAHREVLEETGLQIKHLRHLGFTNERFEMNQKQYIALFVSAEHHAGEVKVMEPDKCEVWQWFDYKRLPSSLFIPISLFLAQHSIATDLSASDKSDFNSRFSSTVEHLYSMHCAAQVLR